MKKWLKAIACLSLAATFLTACGGASNSSKSGEKVTTVKLGIMGANTDVWDTVKERIEKNEPIKIQYVKFQDYNQPNTALNEGSIDLNAFQHNIFLENFNKEHKTDIVSIGNTIIEPFGFYSHKIKDVKELKKGDKIAIPNDVTNGGRALRLLEKQGLIKVDPKKGIFPTTSDITENKLDLQFVELDAAQVPRSLDDVALAGINSDIAIDAGINPVKDNLFRETVDENSKPYINIIAARKKDKDNKVYKTIVKYYQTKETEDAIKKIMKGAQEPAWKEKK
ncbi:MetQ/NlpA family ABC transporter substrate-binding protein [Atopobacter sp. AH10]|uniref:MetQ/NlpA family ABC transporter substrate-binding protein n=1 Tax=Atopobacter sp. AH10 TaxID=2315861 RepID=UPI000EF28FC3|nr:MetQ/NlpA family ABC transporter substrate-binding protein [Atopobacter sp. AH10]RLK62636.1 MetQ/NlpA family ABC transporter substrate-binding protein [Atopobacter sp. AH10]